MVEPRQTSTPEPDREPRHAPEGGRGRSRRRGLAVLLALFVLLSTGAIATVSYVRWCEGASGPQEPVTITVPERASAGHVVTILAEAGVIRCAAVSRLLVRSNDHADAIRAGEHELSTNMTLDDALVVLSTAPPPAPTVTLTIPEGLRLTRIAERVGRLGLSERRFLALAESGRHALPPYLPEGTPTLEGFLFPKTYEFLEEGLTPNEVIRTLLAQFEEEVAGFPWENAERLGLSPYEIVIVASMIEGEAKLDEERELISAVIHNRLAEGMVLGIDATIAYIDPNPEDGLTASDLEIDSPYNTRKHAGLPPTPIGSPRLDSIRAALEPAHVDYLYYVLCSDEGAHRFSVDYGTFLRDKAECLG